MNQPDHIAEFPAHGDEHQGDNPDGHEHQGDNPEDLADEDDDHRAIAEDFARLASEATKPREIHALAQLATAHATLHLGDMLASWFVATFGPPLDVVLGGLRDALGDVGGMLDLSPLLPCGATSGRLGCILPVHGDEEPHVYGPADDGGH